MNATVKTAPPATLFPLVKANAPTLLIVMPDLGNSVMYAKKILAALPKSIAVSGMRLDRNLISRLDGLQLVDIAAAFARDLHVSRSPRPFRLVGHSFAGTLAFETAVQLEKLGEKDVEVILLDSGLRPHSLWQMRPRQWLAMLGYLGKYTGQRAIDRWREYRSGAPGGRILHHRNFLRMDLAAHPPAYQAIIRALYRAMTLYLPGNFSGRLTLFRAAERGRLSWLSADLGWQRFCRQPIRIFDFHCNHLGMVRDSAAAVSVAECLSRLYGPSVATDSGSKAA